MEEREADALLVRYRKPSNAYYTESELRWREANEFRLLCRQLGGGGDSPHPLRLTRRQRAVVRLVRDSGDVTQAAEALGVHRSAVIRTLKRALCRRGGADEALESFLALEFGSALRSNWPRWLVWVADEIAAGRI